MIQTVFDCIEFYIEFIRLQEGLRGKDISFSDFWPYFILISDFSQSKSVQQFFG